jgi:3',5'-cyclic AMP phosphodiesterase CpdA
VAEDRLIRLALLSDLHFGSVAGDVAEALLDDLGAQRPDLVVVAGDLTMRARVREFRAFQAWAGQLRPPMLAIPGNHDIPLEPVQRMTWPFARFCAALGAPTEPVHRSDGLLVIGFNTVSPWQPHHRWQEGRASRRQIQAAERMLRTAPPGVARMVAAHHPFARVPGMRRARPVRRAGAALAAFARNRVEVLMSGHTHQSFVQPLEHAGGSILAVGAPTALSDRQRGEANGYWLIDCRQAELDFRLRLREELDFREARAHRFPRQAGDAA